jgi:hypothetical protein
MMSVRRIFLLFSGFIALILLGLLPANRTLAATVQFRRWLDDGKTITCTDVGGGVIHVDLNNQDVEFANLPADAQFTLHYIDNGVDSADGPFTVEQTSGTHVYGSFSEHFSSYPLKFEFRIDTIVNGDVVYQSSIKVSCSHDTSPAPASIKNVEHSLLYRRWLDNGKTFTCTTVGSVIQMILSNQDVEFNNLPADAQFTLNYIHNGHTETDGPFTVEQTSGTHAYGSFREDFSSYPANFEFRMDTLVDGEIVYRSALQMTCSDDTVSAVPVTVLNPVPAGSHPSSDDGGTAGNCVNPLTNATVQGRLIAATTALFDARSDAMTTIVLNGGSAWWVIGAQNGFYKLWIDCDASPLWVPAGAVTPNQDAPWNGAPLPPAG